jgi:2-succinyl-5-enolpyruvyl-6-hydroxy-3-cyclohexene-1-carboxylate synthase
VAPQSINEIVQICLQYGITNAVISPGSRNAPLIIAFARNPAFRCISITDERSAAYFALGMAGHLRKTVVLICTSGTAALNYAPALAEAFYQNIPLLALTADRPPEWIDQNDGQSIMQQNIYSSFIRKSYNMPVDSGAMEDRWHSRRILSEAINHTMLNGMGPVHINVPLREPLYLPQPEIKTTVPSIAVTGSRITADDSQLASILEKWGTYSKRLVICGFMGKNPELNRLLGDMTENDEIAVIAENLSNISHADFIDTTEPFLSGLSESGKEYFVPGLLITLGGAVLSKGLKNYLREYKPEAHWHIDENDLFTDTYQNLSGNIRMNPLEFFSHVGGTGKNEVPYMQLVREKPVNCRKLHDKYIKEAVFSDLVAYNSIFNRLPACNLHLANSTPVRYAQLFRSRPDILYNSNRGVSGIDGCISTAAGAATVNGQLTVLLSGDVGFIYDSNGLWNNDLPKNLRIIVFNNDGGNIFKIIPTSDEIKGIEHFFETPHNVSIKALTEAYGLEHFLAGSTGELEDVLQHIFKPKERAVVLEIKTSGTISANVFKEYFQYIRQNEQ